MEDDYCGILLDFLRTLSSCELDFRNRGKNMYVFLYIRRRLKECRE